MSHLKFALLLAASLAAAASPAQAETATGYMVIDVKDGAVLAEKNAKRAFIPASVLKMPTALAVLQSLGAGHRFTTRLMHTGTLTDGGVLNGDLVLVGGGDPMLDTPALEGMAQALAAAGITRITGRFLYDDGALPHHAMIEDRQPPDASYNPGLGGLSLDFNRFKVLWNGGNPTGAEIPLDPLPVALAGAPALNEVWLPVREPGRFSARVFQWLAAKHGITLPLPEPSAVPAGAEDLVTHDSPPVAEILRRALFFSNNMATETLGIAAAQKSLGRPVKLPEAAAWTAERTKAAVPATDWAGFTMPNGSGLTDAARMTPQQCAGIALHTARAEIDGVAAADLLPPLLLQPFAAADHRVGAPAALRAKTGTISYARGLAGTLRTKSGRTVAFCIMTDDQEQRAVYDAIPFTERTDDTIRLPSRRWLRAAREAEETAVTGWYSRF